MPGGPPGICGKPDGPTGEGGAPGGGVGAQIDPALECIIVWGADGQSEYGDWGADQVPPAVAHIRRLVRSRAKPAEPFVTSAASDVKPVTGDDG